MAHAKIHPAAMEGGMNPAVSHPDSKQRASSVRGLISAGMDYLRARSRLFTSEASEAGARVGIMGALAGGLLFVGIIGYLLLVLATVFGLAEAFGGRNGWAWGTLVAALLHFTAGAILFVMLRRKAKEPFFPQSREELNKDQQWLTQKRKS